MRKISLIGLAMLIVSIPTFAGDYLTNTNQNAAFLRMIARGASIDVDGVYSNPAGLAFLPKDGLQVALTIQSAYQTRDIAATSPLWTMDGQNTVRKYEGKASAPVIPSIHAVYKKGDWAFSGSFAIVGGGGKASFDKGLPMFDAAAISLVNTIGQGMLSPNQYTINSAMEGRQYIYGFQLGASYKINEHFAVFAGARMNYFTGGYKGFLDINLKEGVAEELGREIIKQLMAGGMTLEQAQQAALQKSQQLNDAKLKLDCDQTGWGITPILGADVKLGKWNIGLKYEFLTNLNLENKTRKAEVRASGVVMPDNELNPLASFKDGVNTPSDIPALLTAAVGYEILPTLRASVEYHHFFDKAAGMAGGKEKALKHGTHEFLVGAEWDVTKQLTLSGGFQRTDYGLADDFQSDISFSCDSYSLGFGAAIKMTKHLTMNVAYFWTNYSDYDKITATGSTTYSRTNKVFGLGVDYKF